MGKRVSTGSGSGGRAKANKLAGANVKDSASDPKFAHVKRICDWFFDCLKQGESEILLDLDRQMPSVFKTLCDPGS